MVTFTGNDSHFRSIDFINPVPISISIYRGSHNLPLVCHIGRKKGPTGNYGTKSNCAVKALGCLALGSIYPSRPKAVSISRLKTIGFSLFDILMGSQQRGKRCCLQQSQVSSKRTIKTRLEKTPVRKKQATARQESQNPCTCQSEGTRELLPKAYRRKNGFAIQYAPQWRLLADPAAFIYITSRLLLSPVAVVLLQRVLSLLRRSEVSDYITASDLYINPSIKANGVRADTHQKTLVVYK